MIKNWKVTDLTNNRKSIIFDLDGTLADTGHDLINAANQCFIQLGKGKLLCPETDKLTALKGGRALLSLGFKKLNVKPSEELINEQYSLLLIHYEGAIDTFTKLNDDVEMTLKTLIHYEWVLGICTNKPERLARILLNNLGILDKFEALIGADTYPFRKPDPQVLIKSIESVGGAMAKSILVGDTLTDYQTARNAQIPIILVGFGPPGSAYEDLDPDRVLMNFATLPALADALIS